MKTLVINLIGAPGTGKTTLMAGIFHKLKCANVNIEMASEFAKELIYEGRLDTMKDELYIFAKQEHKLFHINNKVDVIVTDRPLLLTCIYDKRYGKNSKQLSDLVLETFNSYNNLNFYLKRVNPYLPNGRVQTEEESDEIAKDILNLLDEENINYTKLNADSEALDYIIDFVLHLLK